MGEVERAVDVAGVGMGLVRARGFEFFAWAMSAEVGCVGGQWRSACASS